MLSLRRTTPSSLGETHHGIPRLFGWWCAAIFWTSLSGDTVQGRLETQFCSEIDGLWKTQMRDRIVTFSDLQFTFDIDLTDTRKDGVCELPAERGSLVLLNLINMFHSKYAPNINLYLDFHILNTSQCEFKLHYPFLVDLSHLYEALAGSF